MSSAAGLDQLCAAACEPGMDSTPGPRAAAEIKVVEVDAYASVADLIHAAIVANSGAASLKEIYEVCEHNGRIAYRRAGGSRLITSNDHWKSQVRHALYTGGRFERVATNSEHWQLVGAFAGADAELIKVLVRADDPSCGIYASVLLPPSSGRVPSNAARPAEAATVARSMRRPSRQRRKRSGKRSSEDSDVDMADQEEEASAEAICDSADPARMATRARSTRAAGHIADHSDNLSTQEWEDTVHELPRLRNTRARGRTKPGAYGAGFQTPTSQRTSLQRTGGHLGSGDRTTNVSRASEDPSNLRWGSTGLRNSATVAADSSLSAGRTPARGGLRRPVPRARAPSAEADSPAYLPWFGMVPGERTERVGPPSKRRATQPAPAFAMPSASGADAASQVTPRMMAQWAEHMQQLQAFMMARQHVGDQELPAWSQGAAMPPMAMLPCLLPFMGNHQQAATQLQAFMLAATVPLSPEQQTSPAHAVAKGAANDRARRG